MDTDASLLADDRFESTVREGDGVELHVVAGGDPGDQLVVLLHGFPDFWYGWRRQLGPLVDAGYRVLVPDQRGHNLSDAPGGVDAYRMSELVADIRALIAGEGHESAHVVGHDWGGGVAWSLALQDPGWVDRLAVANSPHPTVFRTTLWRSPRQLLRSWYVAFFQVPRLPEWLLERNDGALLADGLADTAAPGTFDTATIERYRAAWRHSGVGPMLNWYRAARRMADPPRETVTPPTLVCWGEADPALAPSMARASLEYCADGRLETFQEASHWVHVERPGVTEALVDHLAG